MVVFYHHGRAPSQKGFQHAERRKRLSVKQNAMLCAPSHPARRRDYPISQSDKAQQSGKHMHCDSL